MIEENCKNDEHNWKVVDVLTTAVIVCKCEDCGMEAQFLRQL